MVASRKIFQLCVVPQSIASQINTMFRAIGVVIILWYLSSLFSNSFIALDRTLTASLGALETAAIVSQNQFEK